MRSGMKGGARVSVVRPKIRKEDCEGEIDFDTLDPINVGYAIRHDNLCFDARSLWKYIITNENATNPYTRKPFTREDIKHIKRAAGITEEGPYILGGRKRSGRRSVRRRSRSPKRSRKY